MKGRYIQCSVCGLAIPGFMKDGKGGYKHQNPAICAQALKNQPKRQVTIPTMSDIKKFARPIKK